MTEQSPLATLPPITCAAIVTAFAMYPVDIVRALKMASASGTPKSTTQLVMDFKNTHGWSGFIRQGIAAEMGRATFSRVIKFWAQPLIHQSMFDQSEKLGTPVTKGVAGALATIPEVLVISTFENAKLAGQLDKDGRFKGTSDIIRHLYRTRGIPGLFTCYSGMQIRQMLWSGGFFGSLDLSRSYTNQIFGPSVISDVAAGFIAGVVGTTINCWTDVVRTNIQKAAINDTFNPEIKPLSSFNPKLYISSLTHFASVTRQIHATRGLSGLYLGYGIKAFYLGGSGAMLSVLVPRFKSLFGVV